MSQKELARRAKCSQPTISDIERGRNEGSKELPGIAKALGVTVEQLLGKKADISYTEHPFQPNFVVVHSFDEIINNKNGSKKMEFFGEVDADSLFCVMESDLMEGTKGAYIPAGSTLRVNTAGEPKPGAVCLYKLNGSLNIGHFTTLAGIPHLRPSNPQYPLIEITNGSLVGIVTQVITSL